MSGLYVHSLYYYPLKSCSPIRVESAQLSDSGFMNDRRWMIVDSASGAFVSQRKDPVMALLQAVPTKGGLLLRFPNTEELMVPISYECGSIATDVWGDQKMCWDQGDQAAAWLSRVLKRPVRIAYMGDDQLRQVDEKYADQGDTVGFADGFPFLVATEASIQAFNRALGYDICITRFRPNIVIAGDGLVAYQEDQWKRISINGVEFELPKPCSRCVMPSVNPITTEKEPKVIRALAETRLKGKNTYFGQNAIHAQKSGVISVGDAVQVL